MCPRLAWVSLLSLPIATAAVTPPASAAELTEIASAFEEHDPFDLFVGVSYGFEAVRTAIKREYAGAQLGTESGPIPIVKDLVYEQTRHTVVPNLAVGVYKGVQLSVALPIVIADDRKLVFDQRADPCVYTGEDATCINAANSTTVSFDRLLPDGTGPAGLGYDADDPTSGFAADSSTVFRGATRHGLDQLHLGLSLAPMRQEKDDTKPTWIIGGEARLSIGKIMRFDRLDPGSEDGVSTGVHEVMAFTSLSKRTQRMEPFVNLWWLAPVAVRGTDPNDPQGSLFWDVDYGSNSWRPQQRAGLLFGVEAIPWENQLAQERIAVELRGRLEAHFEGRGYSEMWEVFAYDGDLVNNPGSQLAVDLDPTSTGDTPVSFPGVTTIENYLTVGGRIALRGQMGARAKFSAAFEYAHDQSHHITWDDAGEDQNGNHVIDSGTGEVNPLFKSIIDLPGRRYLAADNNTFLFLVSGTLMF